MERVRLPAASAWLGLLVLAACFPIRDFGCHCVPESVKLEMAEDHARAQALIEPWLARRGETLRVYDEALGTEWVALEPGMTGFAPTGVSFPPEGTEAFLVSYAVEARQADASEQPPREIIVGFTMMQRAGGIEPVAMALRAVGPNPREGGPTQDRTFYGCPIGDFLHYESFTGGTSPCHEVPLQPLVRCGCDQPIDYTDEAECARFGKSAVRKSDCRQPAGAPVP